MKRFGPEVEASLAAARAAGAKVSVFDDNGCLLWFCENWEASVGEMEQWKVALGRGWLEFIHPDDLDVVEIWIRERTAARVEFRSMHASGVGWQLVVLQKRRVGLYWLAVGAKRDLPPTDSAAVGALALLTTFGAALSEGRLHLGRQRCR